MTKAQAKRQACGWAAEVIAAAISAGGLEGLRLSEEDESMLTDALGEVVLSLQTRAVGRSPKKAPWLTGGGATLPRRKP